MRNFLRTLKLIGIVVVVVLVCFLILHIPAVDRGLTGWIGSPLEADAFEYRIMIEDFRESLSAAEAPFIYEKDGKLWLLQGGLAGGPMDITPPSVNVAFYASKHNITEELRNRSQCTVREDGRQILFLLNNHDIPTLFLTDLTTGTTVLVATNVDSFLFVGEKVVYACGYEQSNQLYVYDGEQPKLLASDVQSLALPRWNAVASLDREGILRLHYVTDGTTAQLATGVLELYPESGSAVNVPEATVFCRKKGGDYKITASEEVLLKTKYTKEIYTFVGVSRDETREYRFCSAQGILTCVEGEKSNRLFGELGKIYRVLDWDARNEELIVATGTGIYLLRPHVVSGEGIADTVRLLSFKGDYKIYRNNRILIQDFLGVYKEGADRFYIQSLSPSSFILNSGRPESWMNFLSSYLYGLSYTELKPDDNSAVKVQACPVPLSRTLQEPLIAGETLVYKTTYDDGTVRSVTAVCRGEVLKEDLLSTHRESKGQVAVIAEAVGGEIYFTVTPWNEASEYSKLNPSGEFVEGIPKRVVSSMGFAYEWDA